MDRLDLLLAVERWAGLGLVLSALVAPFAFPLLGILWARRPRAIYGPAPAVGCMAALLYSPIALWFAVCHGAYVGDAPRARVGFAWGIPVIAALERYRGDVGTYPDSLRRLVPRYVPNEADLRLPERGDFSAGPTYERDGGGFVLGFEYHGPGVNHCRYRSADRRWACGGYF